MAEVPKSSPTSFLNSTLLSDTGFPELDWNPALPQEEVPFQAGEWKKVEMGREERGPDTQS